WSDLLEPEDLELNKQMSELGLPLSFHTTKELAVSSWYPDSLTDASISSLIYEIHLSIGVKIDIQSRSAEGEGGKEEYW
ncbi:hypothetical protein S83_051458, partial [Arachis hypogaea]